MPVQPVSPRTREMLQGVALPSTACNKITNRSSGMLRNTSVRRMRSRSSQLGAKPLRAPRTMASTVEIAVDARPMVREMPPP